MLSLLNFIFSEISAKLICDGFREPIYATSVPNSNKLVVLEQQGIIHLVENGKVYKTPLLDITDRVHYPLFPGDEMGLLGLAFDPNFIDNGYFYLNYVDKNDSTTVSRFQINQNKSKKNDEKILLKFHQPYSNHNGGCIEFDKNEFLYIATGDGGSAGDPDNRAQDLSSIHGKILRIKLSKDGTYTIPEDNPYKNNKNILPEIWAYGLRNPWRFSFDRLNGNMFIADVGQNLWEEINIIEYGDTELKNFGWNILEGNHCFPEETNCKKDGFNHPIFEYPNNANYVKTLLGIKQKNMDGCSITGGYVYRGKEIKKLYGKYIFGDYCTGKVWSIDINNGIAGNLADHTSNILNGMNKKTFYLSSFGENNQGEIIIVDYNGSIYKLIEK